MTLLARRNAVALVVPMLVGAFYGCGDTAGDDPNPKPGGADSAIDGDSGGEGDGATGGDVADGNTGGDADADAGDDAADAADAADALDAAPSGPLSPTYVDYDYNHILETGQSNSVCNGGDPPITLTQPFTNWMFSTGPMSMHTGVGAGGCDNFGCATSEAITTFAPLVEGDKFFSYAVETSSSGTANEVSYLAQQKYLFGSHAGYPTKHDVFVTDHGRSGWTYKCLRKLSCNYKPADGTKPFAQGMLEVTSAKNIATGLGKTYVVRAVTTIHGESDQDAYAIGTQEFPLDSSEGVVNGIVDYSDGLVEWQKDYEAGVQAITGQTIPVPLLVSQISGQNVTRFSVIAQYELDGHIKAPGKVVLIGPTYMLNFRSDCLHFDNHGSRRLGAYFAKVYSKIVFGGETWEPVRPKLITRVGNVVSVKYYVPVPPLVVDTVQVTDPGNLGFEFLDASGATPAITSVAVTSADTVTITLASTPVGPTMRVRYAQKQTPGTCVGNGLVRAGGARGNIRDSDTTPSYHTDGLGTPYPLQNWGVQYEVPVP